MTRRAFIATLALVAMAQNTIVLPQPGTNGYAVIPPRQGFTTQVLSIPGGGWLIVPPGAQGRSTTPAAPRRWLCRHSTIQRGSALLPGAAGISAMSSDNSAQQRPNAQ